MVIFNDHDRCMHYMVCVIPNLSLLPLLLLYIGRPISILDSGIKAEERNGHLFNDHEVGSIQRYTYIMYNHGGLYNILHVWDIVPAGIAYSTLPVYSICTGWSTKNGTAYFRSLPIYTTHMAARWEIFLKDKWAKDNSIRLSGSHSMPHFLQ